MELQCSDIALLAQVAELGFCVNVYDTLIITTHGRSNGQ